MSTRIAPYRYPSMIKTLGGGPFVCYVSFLHRVKAGRRTYGRPSDGRPSDGPPSDGRPKKKNPPKTKTSQQINERLFFTDGRCHECWGYSLVATTCRGRWSATLPTGPKSGTLKQTAPRHWRR